MVSQHVAVIGAGAAGLVAARELHREGHRVVVFERGSRVGGTWVYTPVTEPDPLGIDPSRPVVHSSLYKSLRTNLPREVMGFGDYPFLPREDGSGDPRRYPGHEEVLAYLEDFTREFGLEEVVKFEKEIAGVRKAEEEEGGKWKVAWTMRNDGGGGGGREEEVFDAVVVCNGHYTEPRIAEIPGIDLWPGKQMHSHNYRTPEPFRDLVVVLIGSAASAVDVSRDIAKVAREVHVASRSYEYDTLGMQSGHDNIWLHPMIEKAHEDGKVTFLDGSYVGADIILHCTGYKYHFPFLETNGIVSVDDNRVGPLYKHVFPPHLAPWLSFVGLPWKAVPFPQFEHQSKWIAGVLSGRISLPSEEEMMEDVKDLYSELKALGIPKRYTHNLANSQFEYNDWLAVQSGSQPSEEWRKEMFLESTRKMQARPEVYRDEEIDETLISQAHEDFAKFPSHR
ncbi:flavin-containing monooxygenase FMO GS-OX-like 4 [Eucalyptus grandis]|uniref:flavin-containing monooxygenase FMO GS-OX-like 4 n=1 Tax=Eucalyptus grandis TaxID=71139 RepID=UPI00192EB34C|nr:flavin-containing monooxygenase FMO GS-OX-like 4 [Eucalyptus grandis]